MPFSYENRKGRTYYLHKRLSRLRDGRLHRTYHFSRDAEQALDQVPCGYDVSEIESSGLPVLKRAVPSSAA